MSSELPDRDEPSIRAVRRRLDRVTDPELDESIVALDYIDEIELDGSRVVVEFTLPTAWCSPAFAWMMATDARDEVESLPDVDRAVVRLHDHMHDAQINKGVNDRLAFGDVFPDADGGVSSVRATLDEKARFSRQYDAFEALLEAGLTGEQIVALRPEDFRIEDDLATVFVRDGTVGVTVPASPIADYLEMARKTGVVDDERPQLFRTPEEEPVPADQFDLFHKRCRLAKVNASGQGSLCDALNDSRNAEDRPPLDPDTYSQSLGEFGQVRSQ
jgi:metal-sulfur cluster biosynthetic enzyme